MPIEMKTSGNPRPRAMPTAVLVGTVEGAGEDAERAGEEVECVDDDDDGLMVKIIEVGVVVTVDGVTASEFVKVKDVKVKMVGANSAWSGPYVNSS